MRCLWQQSLIALHTPQIRLVQHDHSAEITHQFCDVPIFLLWRCAAIAHDDRHVRLP